MFEFDEDEKSFFDKKFDSITNRPGIEAPSVLHLDNGEFAKYISNDGIKHILLGTPYGIITIYQVSVDMLSSTFYKAGDALEEYLLLPTSALTNYDLQHILGDLEGDYHNLGRRIDYHNKLFTKIVSNGFDKVVETFNSVMSNLNDQSLTELYTHPAVDEVKKELTPNVVQWPNQLYALSNDGKYSTMPLSKLSRPYPSKNWTSTELDSFLLDINSKDYICTTIVEFKRHLIANLPSVELPPDDMLSLALDRFHASVMK